MALAGRGSEPIRPGVDDHHACSIAKRSRAETDASCVQFILQLSRAVMSGLPIRQAMAMGRRPAALGPINQFQDILFG
jgi:hypothetical protein